LPMPRPTVLAPPPIAQCRATESADGPCQTWTVRAKRDGGKCLVEIEGGAGATRAACESMVFKTVGDQTLQLTAYHNQVEIAGPFFHATADKLSGAGKEWVLEGHVVFENRRTGLVDKSDSQPIHVTLPEECPADDEPSHLTPERVHGGIQ